nr:uncharacterized protein LOC107279780 isoform X3 [Oryza sativa Japonica Group]
MERRRTGPAATPSPVRDHTACQAVSPPPSIHGGHSTVPPAQGSGEVLRQPEAEEEVRQGQAGEPQLELQSHGGEGSGGGHNPSPASAGSPTRPPHRSTKKIAKLACALMAREAENGIHDPMKGSLRRVKWKQLVAVLRRKSMLYYYGHEISYTG